MMASLRPCTIWLKCSRGNLPAAELSFQITQPESYFGLSNRRRFINDLFRGSVFRA